MLRIGVLISGGGTNLQAILDSCASGQLKARVSIVISDRPAGGLKRAEKAGVPAILLDRKVLKSNLNKAILDLLEGECDLLVLAGYLSILSKELVDTWKGKIINIHPALLPSYGGKGMYGINVHKAVLEAGDKESGCTVHFVDHDIDTGEIILQKKVPVLDKDSPISLQERVLDQEHLALIEALQIFTEKYGT